MTFTIWKIVLMLKILHIYHDCLYGVVTKLKPVSLTYHHITCEENAIQVSVLHTNTAINFDIM